MKLLIVEDEHFVRERIAGIDWASAQIELVGAVGNGKEALSILQKEHLDIIVTDIRMPDMDGLTLARRVNSEYPQVKLIILSGYDDFEYAQESIECNVFKYLVKPVTNELLWETVHEAKLRREQELLEKHKISLLEQRWQEHLPHLRDTYYKNWLHGRYSLWEIEQRGAELNLPNQDTHIWPVVIDMDPIIGGGERFLAKDRALVQFSLYTIARDVFEGLDCVILQDDDGVTVVIFFAPLHVSMEEWKSLVYHRVNQLLSTVKDCMRLTASSGIGPSVQDKQHLPHAFKQSRIALQERIILGNEIMVHFHDKAPVSSSEMVMNDLEKELEIAIETGNEQDRRKLIGEIMSAGFDTRRSVPEAKEVLLRQVGLLVRIVHSHGWTMRVALGDDYDEFEQFNQLLTRDQICEWMERMTDRISHTIARWRQTAAQTTVNEVTSFIQEHLHKEELSLHLVAEKLYVNYSYLSRIFKQVKGESFSEYVLRLRMEKAKELLAGGHKVYESAQQVGYRHVNYFSKAFAKYWGIKPSAVLKN